MAGGSLPFVPPLLAPMSESTPNLNENQDCQNPSPQPMHADLRSFDVTSPEARDHAFTAADEFQYSPTSRSRTTDTTEASGFQTPTDLSDDNEEMYDDEGDNGNQHAQSSEVDPSVAAVIARATKKLRSRCWKEFVPILENGIIIKGRCKHCDTLIGSGSGTSAMLTHLTRCKKRSAALRIVQNLSSTLRSPSGSRLKDWNYDPDVSRGRLTRMIALHEFPFMVVEYDGFRSFIESLNPLFKMPSRISSRNYCMKDFLEKKSELQSIFKDLDCRFSLTTDMWTSNQTLGYICVTCHFIDNEWKLQKRIIKYIDVKTPHTGVELFNNILNCIQEWGIEEKIFGITLDNATANDTMVDLLRNNLVVKKILPLNGELLHHRCAGHVINLIVQDGLQFVEPIIENIRESVKYIRSSQSRKQMFKEILAQEGIKSKKKPSLDVCTRWNSTFAMLERALELRKAFESLEVQDHKYTFAPSEIEWDRADVLCRILKQFNDATELISGSKYPTSNLYFHQMWKIRIILGKEIHPELPTEVAAVLGGMKKKFNKYWNKSYISLCIPVIFDPRYKLKFIEFLFTNSFPKTCRRKLNRLEGLVKQLFLAYSTQLRELNVDPSQMDGVNPNVSATTNDDPWAVWNQQLTMNMQNQVSTEVVQYLDDNPIPQSKDFDILQWWRGNSSKYPVLARIARDVLAIPASSVASEAAFSTGKRIISDFRSSLAPETVEALICLQDWYRAEGSSKFSIASINEVTCDGRQI